MIWAISSIIGLTLSIQIPLSTLSGRMLDQGSHTVADVTVDLLQKTYDDDGISDFRVVRTTVTNAEGEYGFIAITSGQYYVRTRNLISRGDAEFRPAYQSTYYPAATNQSLALPLQVPDDSNLQNIDIIVPKATLVTVRGRVVDGIHLRQPYICVVFLLSAEDRN